MQILDGGVSETIPSKLSVTVWLSLNLLLQPTCASCVTVTTICIYLLLKLKVHVLLQNFLFMISTFKWTESEKQFV